MTRYGATALLLAFFAAGCNDVNNMTRQPRADDFATSEVFADNAAARPPVEHAVPRAEPAPENLRPPLNMATLERGRRQFDTFCALCHGRDGEGAGIIAQHGYPPPPSLHEPRLRDVPDEYIESVITNGLGKMQSYAARLSVADRWAVVAYVRALQLSYDAPVQQLPADLREKLQKRSAAAGGPQ
jgi:mono/diheme cytochrome c family protein